jgi:hypothetical protein
LKVLAHARMKEYQPATALVTSWHGGGHREPKKPKVQVLIEPEDLPELLGQVATLIGTRASRQAGRRAAR